MRTRSMRTRTWPKTMVCAVALALAACGEEPAGPGPTVRVVRVLDGDTVETAAGVRVRYLLVDTPEIAHAEGETPECFGEEARLANESLVLDREVRLEHDVERFDAYGRALAYVWMEGRMINEVLVERGYARMLVIPPNHKHEARLRALAALAQEAGAGLWGACAP